VVEVKGGGGHEFTFEKAGTHIELLKKKEEDKNGGTTALRKFHQRTTRRAVAQSQYSSVKRCDLFLVDSLTFPALSLPGLLILSTPFSLLHSLCCTL